MELLCSAFLFDNRIVPHCTSDKSVRLVCDIAQLFRVTVRHRSTLHFQWKTILVDPSHTWRNTFWSFCQPRPFCRFCRAYGAVGACATRLPRIATREACTIVFVHGSANGSAHSLSFSRWHHWFALRASFAVAFVPRASNRKEGTTSGRCLGISCRSICGVVRSKRGDLSV